MAKIPVSYQPNKIKKGSYTDWIDGGKFCTSINPTGSDTPPTSGLNLLDAFDVDWSAYKIDDQQASANAIISKLNEHQKQIDGETSSWLFEGEPTTTNKPASDWTGTDENGVAFDYRQRHEGDTYTNINNATNKHLDNPDIWENGSSTSESGKSYDAVKIGLTTRIRTKELLRNNKSPKKIKVVAGYSVVIRYFDEDKIQTTGSSDTWLSEFTLNPNYPYFALAFRKNDNSNITIDVLKSFSQSIFTIEGAFDYDPTAGQSWRWCNTDDKYGTGWHWRKIADSDALKALTIANGVREDFDNLEIGGVNLLPNTRTGVGFTFQPLSTGCSGEFDSTNKWFKFTCPQNAITSSQIDTILLKSPTVQLTPGTYTVSCQYRCTQPLNRMQVLCLPVTSEGAYDMDTQSSVFEIKSSNPVTYFKKYSATFTISEDLRDVYGWMIRIDLDHRDSHGNSQELYVKDIKLEKGHKATDWTPTLYEITPDLSGYLRLAGGTMQGNINFKTERNTIYGDADTLHLDANSTINLHAQETHTCSILPQISDANIGSSSKAFKGIYAKQFIIPGGTGDQVLLDNGGVKPLSEFTASSGITQLKIGDGLLGKDNKDTDISEITTSGTITLKTASDNEIGGIKLGYSENRKNYPVEISTDKKAYVNVPWENTDSKVTQSRSTSNGAYPLLCKYDTKPGEPTTNSVKFVSGVTVNPSAQTITTPKLNISHLGASGDSINENVTKPVYNKALMIGQASNGTTCLYINRSGIQAWNSTTDTKLTDSNIPSMYLQGAGGNVICGGAVNATAFYETSDIRKKEIKSDLSLDKCYDLIDKCQTVIYSLKDQTKEQVGMIAQEIEEFFPEVVATDEEGFKSLAYDRLVVICFKVLKDVIKRLEKLES